RSPLRDVAGMLRSFDYVAHSGVAEAQRRGVVPTEQLPLAEAWGRYWRTWASAAFLRGYFDRLARAGVAAAFLPATTAERRSPPDGTVRASPERGREEDGMSAKDPGGGARWWDRPAEGLGASAAGALPAPTPPAEQSPITDDDLHLFNEGTHYRLYEKLGARPWVR